MPVQSCIVENGLLKMFGCATPEAPIEGAVYAPYVEMRFGSSNPEEQVVLTVGNNSAPTGNLAVINSFEYGQEGSSGYQIDIEIMDHGGAMYKEIIRNLNKSFVTQKQEAEFIAIDFGWIINDEDGNTRLKTSRTTIGTVLTGVMTSVETSFAGGNVKIKVKITAPQDIGSAQTGSEGSNDQLMDLKTAIRNVLVDGEQPLFSSVSFRSASSFEDAGADNNLEFEKSKGGEKGPPSVWPKDQMSVLSCVRSWLSTVTSADGRGLMILYDAANNGIIIQEDPLDPSGQNSGCCTTSVATYIVNGGNCSPVIEFSPSVQWAPTMVPGKGGTNGGASGGNAPLLEPINNIQDTGSQTSPTMESHVWNFIPPKDQADNANKAIGAAMDAEEKTGPGLSGGTPAWSADLKIMGDPFYTNVYNFLGKSVSILFINPYYFGNEANSTWLQTSLCNTMLSNKRYMIKRVNHSVSAGSYTTTLQLQLNVPNIDIDWDSSLGGNGCGSLEQNFVDAPAKSTL